MRLVAGGLSALWGLGSAHPRLWGLLVRRYPSWAGRLARWHAAVVCRLAAREVPAYRAYLAGRGAAGARRLEDFPETSKAGYVLAYSDDERCRDGRLTTVGTVVDESAGSSGTPLNWPRGRAELAAIRRNLACYVAFAFPSTRLVVVNAYSMGAWATGTTTGAALARVAMVKNTGPDLDKVAGTLRHFGPDYHYVVTAYPPFLKHLRDRLDAEGFDWGEYRIDGLVGGEPITEGLRGYLEERFGQVLSGYGASDLTIGIGGESPLSVWLRRRLADDAALRAALLGPDEQRVPMILHYNPLETYLETNARGELLCTLTGRAVLAPRLRYNVGDEGRVLSLADLERVLADRPDLRAGYGAAAGEWGMRLPLLLLFGRSDSTVSYMGANLYPQDVETGLYEDNPWAPAISRFALSLGQREDHEVRPAIHVELRAGTELSAAERAAFARACRERVLAHLARVSRDVAQSLRESPTAGELAVHLWAEGEGPFAGADGRIKNRYLVGAR